MAASSSVANTIAEAGLERISPFESGIRRSHGSKDVTYVDELGQRVVDAETISRIKALANPPAWRDVWISPHPLGHIQATGFDAAYYGFVWRRPGTLAMTSALKGFETPLQGYFTNSMQLWLDR